MKNLDSPIPKQLRRLQPRYVLAISTISLVLLFLSAFFELNQTRREIHHLLEEEAATLMKAIQLSGANAINAYLEIEKLVEGKLFSAAHFVEYLDQRQLLTANALQKIAAANQILRINLFDAQGKKILSNFTAEHDTLTTARIPLETLEPILAGHVDELVLGLKTSRHPEEKRFAVAIKRARGGVIVVNVDAQFMLDFRKSVGVGRLMQDIGDYEGIEYLVLQDFSGIILASKSVERMNSLESDSFLVRAVESEKILSRFREYAGHQVFEFVQPFILDDEPVGLFRLGLKTDHLEQASSRIKRRMLIISTVMGLIILIFINFLTVSQNFRLVNEAYRRIQTFSKSILEHMADAVIAIDRDQRIILFNSAAAELFKLVPEQVLNRPVDSVIKADIYLDQALVSGQTVIDEEKILELGDRRRIISASTSILTNPDGTVESAFVVLKDLTEKFILEENLKRKEKLTAMGQLASGVAHEIRNPLNAIAMIAQRLHREFLPTTDGEEYADLTQIVVSETRRIDQIIQQFLRFARPPALNLAETNLLELLESTILLVNTQAQEKGVRIQTFFNEMPWLVLDQNQMKQVFLNLLRNSLEAIEGRGEISVSTKMTGANEIEVGIADNGPGMDAATRAKIFNLYFTTKSTGTGLGLSVVHQIISQHNGRIEVESAPGQGARFIIYLPVKSNLKKSDIQS
jgi:PAS domain S-box-containing protein